MFQDELAPASCHKASAFSQQHRWRQLQRRRWRRRRLRPGLQRSDGLQNCA